MHFSIVENVGESWMSDFCFFLRRGRAGSRHYCMCMFLRVWCTDVQIDWIKNRENAYKFEKNSNELLTNCEAICIIVVNINRTHKCADKMWMPLCGAKRPGRAGTWHFLMRLGKKLPMQV